VDSKDKNKWENVSYILGEFRENETYYRIIKELIIKSDGDSEILGGFSSTIFSSFELQQELVGNHHQNL
jgi:hypothetical protein